MANHSKPDAHLSDPLTYWWGVTLCPPELNDVALAEAVVIQMTLLQYGRCASMGESQQTSLAKWWTSMVYHDGMFC